MKKLILIFLLLPALAFANDISTIAGKAISAVSTIAGKAKADIATVAGGGVPAAVAASCPANDSHDNVTVTTRAAGETFGSSNDNYFLGTIFTPTANVTICKIGVMHEGRSGDITGKTYTVKIWTVTGSDGSYALGDVVSNGTSAGVTGNNDWNQTWEYGYTWSEGSMPSLTASTVYAITISHGSAADGTNYVKTSIGTNGAATDLKDLYLWTNLEAYYYRWTDREPLIKIFYYD